MSENESCANCKAWLAPNEVEGTMGYCRLHPPVWSDKLNRSTFPRIMGSGWCMDWVSKTKYEVVEEPQIVPVEQDPNSDYLAGISQGIEDERQRALMLVDFWMQYCREEIERGRGTNRQEAVDRNQARITILQTLRKQIENGTTDPS